MITAVPGTYQEVQEKRKQRVDAVLEILRGIHFKHAADKEELILKFVNSNLSLHEISILAKEIPQ